MTKGGNSGNPRRRKPKSKPLEVDLDVVTSHDQGKPLTESDKLQLRNITLAEEHANTLRGQRGKDDFWYFIHHIWGPRHPGYQKLTDDCHKKMARHFQDMILEWEWVREEAEKGHIEGYVVRYAQEAARGLGKSLIWTIAGSAWTQLRNPDMSLVIDTRTEALGIAFLHPIASVLRGYDRTSRFIEFYGNWFSNQRTWDRTQIVHAKRVNMGQIEPSFDIAATNMSQTSRHPSGVLTDDPINENDDKATIKQAIRHHRSWANIIRVPGFHGYSGTPYVEGDVISYMKENESGTFRGAWQWVRIPALNEKDQSVAPQIRPTEWLHRKRQEDPVNFASQFMLTPGEGDHQWLKLSQFYEAMLNPADVYSAGFTSIHSDCAWADDRSNEKGDGTAIVASWNTPNYSVIVDCWHMVGAKQSDYFNALAMMMRALGDGVRRPMIITMDADSGGYGGATRRLHEIEMTSRGLMLPRVVLINRQSQQAKTRRIILGAGEIARGRIRFLRGLPNLEEIAHQFTKINVAAHDDLAEVVSDVLNPEVNKMQIFGREASLWDAENNEDRSWMLPDETVPLPSHIAGERPAVNYDKYAGSMETPRHDPDLIEELIREVSRGRDTW